MLPLCLVSKIQGYVSIGYPFAYLWALTFFNSATFLKKAKSTKPKLFIIGTRDNFTGLETFQRTYADFPEPKDLQVVRGADHFFFGIEDDLCVLVKRWLAMVNSH